MNRETYLNTITSKYLVPHFKAQGYDIPTNIRMACSLTSGRGAKNKAIGLCWNDSASADNTFEIMISPTIADSSRVIDILIHEVCHAVVGLKAGHGSAFKRCAQSVGLTGKMTATTASEGLKATIEQWVSDLGNYPHAVLQGENSGKPKQGTRMLKATCADCGYTVRLSAKWAALGSPICPCCNDYMLMSE
jgi:hypothetical protein